MTHPPDDNAAPAEPEVETAHPAEFVAELRRVTDALPERINVDSRTVEQGLAKLVLTLIELLRRLLEKQAVRRMEGGGLTPEQVEELGLALMKLEAKMGELKGQFGLTDEDLQLDLGPIGRLL
ncbi:MAG TPA: gas vesicle protein K [Pyrinomonadaceae bacterium]|nr:gas vesicle protein K [Pyrinomonadaceae bacterium]